ncbi:MAG: M48 family metallopeptidase [Verrucomicrobia bacterium]|nr:M48 family metallopeptidase [Verrucomicrobiota bacterium]
MALGGGSVRLRFFLIIVYITPIFAGVVLVLFMVKPFFARRGPAAQPLALNPGAEPALFSFVTRLCESIGAPFPTRIDVDCQLNASASFRRGMLSFLGSDLVLTIGAPLVAGLTLQQFAGVLAHEFGHFTQGFGMRLTYVIRRINGWFARVVYERDSWDMVLEEWAADSDYRVALMVGIARLGVWLSRLVLRALMLAGPGIGCFMLRQMEYDADSYQIKVAGSACFESAMRRINILGASMEGAYKHVRTTWNMSKALPDDLAFFLVKHDAHLPAERRTELEDTLGLQTTGLWDTHPSSGDRIRKARQSGEPGIFHLVAPASVLFGNFEAISKQVTLLHYQDDLQLPLLIAKLRPSDSFKL